MIKEFKEFINKGNMVEIAVGLLIAAAFGALVSAFTKDLINPIIGLFGKVDFSNMMIVLKDPKGTGPYSTPAAADAAGAVVLRYGAFISEAINFLITGLTIFIIVKAYNKLIKKPTPVVVKEPVPTREELLLTEIRDLLKAR